jgi:hypothetical protein
MGSRNQMGGIAKGSAHDVDESRIMPSRPNGQDMTDQKETGPHQPQLEAKADGGREGAIDDGDGSRRTAEEDRLA